MSSDPRKPSPSADPAVNPAADEEQRGLVDSPDPAPDDPDAATGVSAGLGGEADRGAGGDHVAADMDWAPGDEDDPDLGSGRTGEQ